MGITLEIILNQRNVAFRPGSIIEGHVLVSNNGEKPVKINGFVICLYGEEFVTWKIRSCFWIPFVATIHTTETYRDGHFIVGQTIQARGTSELEVGNRTFPFRFQLPLGCPSSYRSNSLQGHVSYKVIANIETSSFFSLNKKTTVAIPVLGISNLVSYPGPGDVDVLSCREAIHAEIERKEGRHRVQVELPRICWIPGELVPFIVHVSKDKPFSWTPKVTLCKEEFLQTRRGHTSETKTTYIVQVRRENEKGMNLRWDGEIRIPVDTVMTNLGGASFIVVNYYLKVHNTGVDTVKIPIVIGTGFYGGQQVQ